MRSQAQTKYFLLKGHYIGNIICSRINFLTLKLYEKQAIQSLSFIGARAIDALRPKWQ